MSGRGIADQIVWSLACEAREGDVAVIGVATPIAAAAAQLARALLVTDMTLISAASVDPAPYDIAVTMTDAGAIARNSSGTMGQAQILDSIQRGRVSLQFISPAQVDGAGRLNTSRVPHPDGGIRRLPGGLATGDIAVLIGRLVAYRAAHTPRFLPAEVTFATGAGHDGSPDGGRTWRTDRALPGAGVQTIVTDVGVIRWAPEQHAFRLASVHPGHKVEEAKAGCGFPLASDDNVPTTTPPPEEAMQLLEQVIDPSGLRRLEVPAERADAQAQLAARR